MLMCLAHLHAAGVIHRDIKLENLFVSPTRGVLLGDFGLALCTHEEKPISPVGTLGARGAAARGTGGHCFRFSCPRGCSCALIPCLASAQPCLAL